MQVPVTVRSPQHSLVLLAVAALRPNEQLIVLSLPCIRNLLVLRLVEAVDHLADSPVAPAVGSAVGSVGVEQGIVATEALDLDGQPAVLPQRRRGMEANHFLDLRRYGVDPAVFAESLGVGHVSTFLVRVVKLARLSEDPFACHRGHVLIEALAKELQSSAFVEAVEPLGIVLVILGEWNPLGIKDHGCGPFWLAIQSIDLRVAAFHNTVHLGNDVREGEVTAENTDTEVIVARPIGVVSHFSHFVEQSFDGIFVVPPYCSEAVRTLAANRFEVVVGVAVDFDSVVGDNAEITRATSKNSIEEVGVRTGIDGLDLGIVVYKPDLTDMVAKQSKATTKLTVASCLCIPTDVHISALPVREEEFVVFQKVVQLARTPTNADIEE